MNKVMLAGRLTRNPEPKMTKNSTPISRTAIAVKDFGGKTAPTQFFNIVGFNNQANFMNAYLHRGDFVVLEGKLSLGTYIDRNGDKAKSTSIIIDSIYSAPARVDNVRKEIVNNNVIGSASLNAVNDDMNDYLMNNQQDANDTITDEEISRTFDFSDKSNN